ncbi:O-antigen ligase family protein [Flavobacterium flavigenum]|uniref:O-antigen ligase family protein n=1 Tax=Flavobacterium flavigenum TaxID=3003258 RepID=UPI0024831565|nr:O-antigen ligase family protein [Flavobacterium flavigenum]
MVLELLFLGAFLFYFFRVSEKRILYLIFFLLPIHGTIKYLVFKDGGEIFAVWKELGILALFFRTLNVKNYAYTEALKIFVFFSIFILVYTIIGIDNDYRIAGTFKKLFFPFFLTISVSKIRFTSSDIKMFFLIILLGSLLINITGVVDFVSPTIRYSFRNILGASFEEASDGTLYYDNSSFQIMGYDRVSGLITGGPNQMGIFNSAIVILGLFCWVNKANFKFSALQLWTLLICLGVSTFCLLTSFSRAGWAILLITFLYVLIVDERFRSFGLKYVLIALFFVTAIIFSVPKFYFIIESTLSGKEASASARGDMTLDALEYLFENPQGKGLGATDYAHTHFNTGLYFAESSLINFGIELGIFGLLLLLILKFRIGFLIRKNIGRNAFATIGFGFLLAYIITSAVSVNTYENPFVYYAWMIFGLSLNTQVFNKMRSRRLIKKNNHNNEDIYYSRNI